MVTRQIIAAKGSQQKNRSSLDRVTQKRTVILSKQHVMLL